MTSGIYVMYWNNNLYFYFGQSKHIELRAKEHFWSMETGRHKNKRIQNVYNKYGRPIIELWLECIQDDLDDAEQFLISFSLLSKKCLNIRSDVKTLKGYRHTDETKKKISNASKITASKRLPESWYSARNGLVKYNQLRSEGLLTQICKPESKLKMSEKRKLEKHPRAKKVIDTVTGIIYGCARSASNDTGINYSTLRDWLNNRKPNKSNLKFYEP